MATPTVPVIPAIAQSIINGVMFSWLGQFMALKVNEELGLPIGDRSTVKFTYAPMLPTWKGEPPIFFYNGSRDPMTVNVDYEFDTDGLDNAIITLISGGAAGATLEPGNEIRGTYHHQYFTDAELYYMLDAGLSELNLRKPATAYDWTSIPLDWNTVVSLYAANRCIERILGDTTLWRSRVIFADPQYTQAQLQNRQSQLAQQLDFLLKVTKRRGEGTPKAIFGRKFSTQQMVTNSNWWQFAQL
jgi:hypothetical protein